MVISSLLLLVTGCGTGDHNSPSRPASASDSLLKPEAQQAIEQIKADNFLTDIGFTKSSENEFWFNYPSRGTQDRLCAVTQVWLGELNQEGVRVDLTFGYFPSVAELSRAWTGYRVRTNRPGGHVEEGVDGTDLPVKKGPFTALFLRKHFLIEVHATYTNLDRDLDLDSLANLQEQTKSTILTNIEIQRAPPIEPFEVDFQTAHGHEGFSVDFVALSGVSTRYSYILKEESSNVREETLTDFSRNGSIVFDDLSPGSYSLVVYVVDALSRVRTFSENFTISETGPVSNLSTKD